MRPPPKCSTSNRITRFVANFIGENNRLLGKVVDDRSEVTVSPLKSMAMAVATRFMLEESQRRRDRRPLKEPLSSLRPERVIVVMPEPGSPAEHICNARAEELIYLGDHIRTRFSVCGNDEFIVKIPNSAEHAQPQGR